jgi:hypothetical protein
MNSLIFLTDQDFSVQQGKKGNVLCNTLPGISLVLFFSKQCTHCHTMLQFYPIIAQAVPACQIALLNISSYPRVARMSQQTIAPITYVPFMILYVNGRPFVKYNGPKTLQDIINFLTEVLSRIQSKTSNFKSNPRMVVEDEYEIPEYSFGVPFNMVCEGEQCYLSFSEAYKTNGKKQQPSISGM